MPGGPCSGVSLPGPSGVRRRYGGRHVRTVWAEQERPVCPAFVGRGQVYKPMVKSPGGQRESEGAVVPVIGVQHNAPGGKRPHFDRASGEGKHQGMAGSARFNYPGGPSPAVAGGAPPPAPGIGRAYLVNVRQLQGKLWAAAKQSPERRLHVLYDRIHRG
jgi:hypothetical protein